MQSVRVKIVRMKVGGSNKPHTIVKQGNQQAMKNHCIGNVRHMKLIKTDQLITL